MLPNSKFDFCHNVNVSPETAVAIWTAGNERILLCEMEDGVVENLDYLPFTSKGSPTLTYNNNVINHRVEAGIYTKFRKRRFIALDSQKAKLSLRPSTQTFIPMSHTCRRRFVSCCWDVQWQLCSRLRKSRGTARCPEAKFHKAQFFR